VDQAAPSIPIPTRVMAMTMVTVMIMVMIKVKVPVTGIIGTTMLEWGHRVPQKMAIIPPILVSTVAASITCTIMTTIRTMTKMMKRMGVTIITPTAGVDATVAAPKVDDRSNGTLMTTMMTIHRPNLITIARAAVASAMTMMMATTRERITGIPMAGSVRPAMTVAGTLQVKIRRIALHPRMRVNLIARR
jgi:hypothetical protein